MENNYTINDDIIDVIPEDSNDDAEILIGVAEDNGDNYKEDAAIPIDVIPIDVGDAADVGDASDVGDAANVGDATEEDAAAADAIPIDVGDATEEDPLYIIKKMELLARASYIHQYGNIKSPIHQVMEINL